MARDKEAERAHDVATIDSAIGRLERYCVEYDTPEMALALAKQLPALLTRRAALLGLDLTGEQPGTGSGTLAELERKLALVGPSKAS